MAFTASTVLPEINAKDASGVTSEIYRSIEAALGVRLVNLVYRHLATVPGALEWAWAVVGDGFKTEIYKERSAPLADFGKRLAGATGDLRLISLKGYGLTPREAAAVRVTLNAYNRANPMNALSLRVIALALSAGWRPPAVRTYTFTSVPPVDLLPMGRLQDLDGDTSSYLSRLALYTTGVESDLVPSLFRHFVPWPSFLAGLGDWLQPLHEDDLISHFSSEISREADAAAKEIFDNLNVVENTLAAPNEDTRLALSRTLAQFLPAICRMIVIGGLLSASIR